MAKDLKVETAKQDILLLASKEIGFNVFSYLLKKKFKVSRCLVGSNDDTSLIKLAKKQNISVEVFSKDIQNKMEKEGSSYKWLLNIWCPHILSKKFLSLADKRVNIHPAIVPLCRGNDCAAWTIRKDMPAGVSLLEMETGIDTGGVYTQKRLSTVQGERGRDMHRRLLNAAEELFKKSWQDIFLGKIVPLAQNGSGNLHTRKETEADRKRDGSERMSLSEMINWALAHDFSPKTTAEVNLDNNRYSIEIKMRQLDKEG